MLLVLVHIDHVMLAIGAYVNSWHVNYSYSETLIDS